MNKRLHKSNSNKMIDGVCGGIAEYFSLDPTLVRLGWILILCPGRQRHPGIYRCRCCHFAR